MIRTGDCRQCGQCCRRLGWLWVFAGDDTIEWMQAHDPEITIIPDEDAQGYYWVSVPYPCKQLIDIGDGKYSCAMHDKKPRLCKQYPESTDELKPGCGYRFAENDAEC